MAAFSQIKEPPPIPGRFTLALALKPDGVLYGSFKYGEGEIEREGRCFTHQTEQTLSHLMQAIPTLAQIDLWISADVRADRAEQWLNFLYRRID